LNWLILVIANIILSSFRDIYNKKVLKNMEPMDYTFGYILSTNIIFGLTGFALGWFSNFVINYLLIINSIITVVALLFYFKAMKIDDVSKISPLQNINILFIVVFAALFLKEVITPLLLFGCILITFGVYIIHLKGKNVLEPIEEISKSKSFKFIIIYSLFISINIILGKFLVSSIEPKTYFFIFFNFSFIFLLLYLIFSRDIGTKLANFHSDEENIVK